LPTDYARLSRDLSRFYEFTGKVVLYVGAGGRQLLDPSTPVRKLIAVDRNAEALRELRTQVAAGALRGSVEVIAAAFEEVSAPADVVYFEFCLHEMDDPEKALLHARSLAPDVVVYDHSPGSEWVYYGAEEDKVHRSFAVMQRLGVRRRKTFQNEQRFATHAELLAKVGPQGPLAVERAQRFAGAAGIAIPMSYELDLL
jgi:ubiquinone/menaquinone biosynthesis C-methylase UbiE